MTTSSSQSAAPRPPVLRTAAVWGTYVLASRELAAGDSLEIGDSPQALVNRPDGSEVSGVPIRSVGSGWELDPRGVTGGIVHLRGRAEDARALGDSGAPVPIVAGDHGLLQYGAFSVFFQFSESVAPPRGRLRFDASLLLAFLFAIITLCGGLLLLSLMYPDQPIPQPLELTSPEELKVRYKVYTPPPVEKPPADAEGTKAAKPKADAPGGKRRSKAKPRRNPGPKRTTARKKSPTPGLSAVTDAMQGAAGKEVLKTLGSISSVADALGELKASSVVVSGGSRLAGLRGSGSGSGGKAGVVSGAGTLKTGLSGGRGSGSGRGKGRGKGSGAGGKGSGGERKLKGGAGVLPGQGLGRAQISRVVRKRAGAFQACYESALARSPGLSGGLTVNFSVAAGGKVQSARIASSSLKNKRVEGCVLRMFRRLRFPRADKGTKVNWPLVFKGKG